MAKNRHNPEEIVTKPQQVEILRIQDKNKLSLLYKGNILQPSANVDLTGANQLKDILEHDEAIPRRRAARKPPPTGVSLLITHHQKAQLRERGYTDDQLHAMTSTEAHRLLGLADG